jgi:hypothetical protein
MKKTTVINNTTQTWTEALREAKMKPTYIVSPDFNHGDWFTMNELSEKFPKWTRKYMELMRSTYLYSETEYKAFMASGNGTKHERALKHARKLEAEAARIRYRLKRDGFIVTVTETNKGDK